MNFIKISPDDDLSEVVQVLNKSHGTVAEEFGFTKESNPSNNAFVDAESLRKHLMKGIELFLLTVKGKAAGCIAIEKSMKEEDTFYIEKVSVLPEYRHNGYGVNLMNFAIDKIKEQNGKQASLALIDSNKQLKEWYLKQGFIETGTKDFLHLPFRVCFMSKQISET